MRLGNWPDAQAFFRAHGERQVSIASLIEGATWNEQVIAAARN
jgi:hypothetical protein